MPPRGIFPCRCAPRRPEAYRTLPRTAEASSGSTCAAARWHRTRSVGARWRHTWGRGLGGRAACRHAWRRRGVPHTARHNCAPPCRAPIRDGGAHHRSSGTPTAHLVPCSGRRGSATAPLIKTQNINQSEVNGRRNKDAGGRHSMTK